MYSQRPVLLNALHVVKEAHARLAHRAWPGILRCVQRLCHEAECKRWHHDMHYSVWRTPIVHSGEIELNYVTDNR